MKTKHLLAGACCLSLAAYSAACTPSLEACLEGVWLGADRSCACAAPLDTPECAGACTQNEALVVRADGRAFQLQLTRSERTWSALGGAGGVEAAGWTLAGDQLSLRYGPYRDGERAVTTAASCEAGTLQRVRVGRYGRAPGPLAESVAAALGDATLPDGTLRPGAFSGVVFAR